MAKKKSEEVPPNTVVIENVGPIKRAVIPFAPGCVTVLEGTNGAGKSETLEAINALAGLGTDGLTIRDGAEEGFIAGFGCQVKLTARQSRRTGQIDILVVEEGFSLAGFVRPGLKGAEANDRRRLQDLASVLGVKVEQEAVYDLLGGFDGPYEGEPAVFTEKRRLESRGEGRGLYRDVVTEKTIKATDPAAYVASLKRDLDAAALEWEKEANVWEGEAGGMEATLPPEDQLAGESDPDILREAVTLATNAKHELERLKQTADQMKALAEEARAVLNAGQGETVEAAQAEQNRIFLLHSESYKMVQDLEKALRDEQVRLEGLGRDLDAANARVESAEDRAKALEEASADLQSKCTAPTEEEFAEADRRIAAAEAALLLGGKIRDAVALKATIAERRQNAEAHLEEAAELRAAAKKAVSLLVGPINGMGCGVEVDDNMRLVVTNHPVRGRCFVEDLSAGEGWSLAIKLMARMHGGDDVPALVAIPQEAYEGLDGHNRQMFLDAVAATKLMVVTAKASSELTAVIPVSGSIVEA